MTALPVDSLRTLLPLLLAGLAVALAFIKLSVVLAVLRRGLGGGVPPTAVIALLALLLATLAMAPTAERCQRLIASLPSTATAEEVLHAGSLPLREFLQRHTPPREQQAVLELALRLAPPTADQSPPAPGRPAVTPDRPAATPDRPAAAPDRAAATPDRAAATPDRAAATPDRMASAPDRAAATIDQLTVLAPAFALSELRAAFLLGFGLLLPLLLIDLLCAVLLAGLDLGALSPRAVALPFKLLLFVLCDGWQLVLRGLLLGYS